MNHGAAIATPLAQAFALRAWSRLNSPMGGLELQHGYVAQEIAAQLSTIN
jgi:hypothetical protein